MNISTDYRLLHTVCYVLMYYILGSQAIFFPRSEERSIYYIVLNRNGKEKVKWKNIFHFNFPWYTEIHQISDLIDFSIYSTVGSSPRIGVLIISNHGNGLKASERQK